MVERYQPRQIERKWQERWERDGIYHTPDDDARPKFYFLTMFPYTSGDLHIGHWYAMAPSDAAARFRRMQGYNVLFPMGFDAFGLPAENAAIRHGIHPKEWTLRNIERMRQQLKSMGSMIDWRREVITCEPEYYRWNQWFFLKMYERGLAYKAKAPANWCPSCQTVLANEQVLPEGTCERCHSPVTRRDLDQWLFRITAYAEELLDHSHIQWPEPVVVMQKNWIGRSEGLEVAFPLEGDAAKEGEVIIFTTRPDTIYGVTFMALAPEHPLVPKITTPRCWPQVETYIEEARRQTEIQRLSTVRQKTGVFTGAYCRNPLSGEKVPIFVADYVLPWYGTGAVMGVPAHDQRDFEFAQEHGLPIKVVLAPPGWKGEPLEQAHEGPGVLVGSGPFNGMPSHEAQAAICDYVEKEGWGKRKVIYRLRDWLISRQRYWGTPIPIVYCPSCGTVPVPQDQLPVTLPDDVDFRPTGESPLARHEGFVNTPCPRCGGPARRETDTMDTFVDSSWYFMRYLSPHCQDGPFDVEKGRRWLPVDQYTGGAEHAVMHLLYARFFWKVCRDLGLVQGDEPFLRLFNQGQILGPDGQRMSKSRGNVVAPDEQIEQWGVDTFRCYLMFLGPWEQGGPYTFEGIQGIWRWLNRVWNLCLQDVSQDPGADPMPIRRTVHGTIKKVTEDMERFRFNTAIAALMDLTNHLVRFRQEGAVHPEAWEEALSSLLLMLAPLAPHIAEELWERRGWPYSIHQQAWPTYDPDLARPLEVTLVVQVNGKVRDKIQVPADISEEEARRLALESPKVRHHIDQRPIERIIYVPGRLINLVVR